MKSFIYLVLLIALSVSMSSQSKKEIISRIKADMKVKVEKFNILNIETEIKLSLASKKPVITKILNQYSMRSDTSQKDIKFNELKPKEAFEIK